MLQAGHAGLAKVELLLYSGHEDENAEHPEGMTPVRVYSKRKRDAIKKTCDKILDARKNLDSKTEERSNKCKLDKSKQSCSTGEEHRSPQRSLA